MPGVRAAGDLSGVCENHACRGGGEQSKKVHGVLGAIYVVSVADDGRGQRAEDGDWPIPPTPASARGGHVRLGKNGFFL